MPNRTTVDVNLDKLRKELKQHFSVDASERLNTFDLAWLKIFKELDTLDSISDNEPFHIEASRIKDITGKEPRLMAKHDFSSSRPWVFRKNNLSIIPLSRREYQIVQHDIYQKFPNTEQYISPIHVEFPSGIESFDYRNMGSEALQLNAALIAGIYQDFLEEPELRHTLSGRMTNSFQFRIKGSPTFNISGAQLEIDAGFEGNSCIAVVEAKSRLGEDFNVRQLYYPFRKLFDLGGSKRIRPIYQVYTDGMYWLHEYLFRDPEDMGSIEHVQTKVYTLTDEVIHQEDLVLLARQAIPRTIGSADIPFPQANSFARILNICESVNVADGMTKEDISIENGFVPRQADYYVNAGRFLNLLELNGADGTVVLTSRGQDIFSERSQKQRRLMLADSIFSIETFKRAYLEFVRDREAMTGARLAQIIRDTCGRNYNAVTTNRRASTVKQWLLWLDSITTF